MVKNIALGLMVFALVILGVELRSLWVDKMNIEARYNDAKKQFDSAKAERDQLQASLESLSIPENLSKELRARFHYQAPDEKVLILVPRSSTTEAATGTQ